MTIPRIIKHLEDVGENGTAEEFKDALMKFGDREAAAEALHKGLQRQARYEDSGDYTSPASSGYRRMLAKQKIMQDYDLRRGIFADFNAVAEKNPSTAPKIPANNNNNADPLRQIEDLTRRVEELENAPKIGLMQQIKLKK